MKTLLIATFALAWSLLLSGPGLAQSKIPARVPQAAFNTNTVDDYRIGVTDRLSIRVFQVDALSLQNVQVDTTGQILLPLIGSVRAQGKTTRELSAEIAQALGRRYLQNPEVSVLVEEAASQKVTVDGAVVEAGVFPMRGRTSLLQAVAMAKGANRVADLNQVVVFREVEGRRMVGAFNLKAIMRGAAEDPEIRGNDVVIVSTSGIRNTWQNVISTLPAFGVFAFF